MSLPIPGLLLLSRLDGAIGVEHMCVLTPVAPKFRLFGALDNIKNQYVKVQRYIF